MTRKFAIALLILYWLIYPAGGFASAQESVTVQWEIEPTPDQGWTIGDPIHLQLIATGPSQGGISLPELPDQWGPFEVSDQELLEPIQNDNDTITIIREATVIPWSVGELETPPVSVQYRDAQGEIQEKPAPALTIAIGSVLPGDDTEKRDLKPQASLSLNSPPIWPWILGGIVATVLISALVWWIIRRSRRKVAGPEAVAITDDRYPEEIAYEKLDHIAALDLPVTGKLKHHYEMVTDCMRAYLEGIYHIPAKEQTTGEIMISLRKLKQSTQHDIVPSLRSLLEEADMVKFAKFTPSIECARSSVDEARRLVDITKPDRDVIAAEGKVSLTPDVTTNTRQ